MRTRTGANSGIGRISESKLTAAVVVGLLFLCSRPLLASYSSVQTPEDTILSKGFAAYMDGNDRKALSYFEEVIRINPQNHAAEKGLEKVKARLKKVDDADHQRAMHLAKSKYNEGRELEKTDDIVAAIDSYHEAVDAVPDFSPAKSRLADIKHRMEKVAQQKSLHLGSWFFSRGAVAYLDRDWAKAWRIWSERLTLEPNNIPLANATARAENKFKRMMMSEQEEFFRRGGRAFYEQGLYVQAKTSWSKILALRPDDQEAMEGMVRSEEAILRAQGKGRETEAHDVLEEALEHYANQDWKKALVSFQRLIAIDPNFSTANDYIAKINRQLASPDYIPMSVSEGTNWRGNRSSNQGGEVVKVPDRLQNYAESKKELQSKLNRDPSNIRAQQALDQITKSQEEESERIYKDGLIAYSQGNRPMAIQQWKQVLVINPEHKKAAAALRKARAEEDRTSDEPEQK